MLRVSLALLVVPLSVAQTASIHEQLGRKYEANGALAQAAAEYEQAIQLSPYEEAYYFEAAHARLLQQEFEAAVKILERGRKVFDKSAQLELALGVALYGERRFAEAASSFLRTIDLAPEVQQPYVFLSKMLDQTTDRLPQIMLRFEAWAAANPNDPLAQFAYAKVLLANDADPEKVEQLLRTSIRLKGDQWESHYELGILLEKQRKFAEAVSELERSAAINPNEAGVRYHLARVYDRLGQSDRAAEQRAVHKRLTDTPGGK